MPTFTGWFVDVDLDETISLGEVEASNALEATSAFRARLDAAGVQMDMTSCLEVVEKGKAPVDLVYRRECAALRNVGRLPNKPKPKSEDAMDHVDPDASQELVS